MNVWLAHMGEPLPIDGPVRLHRYGILSTFLSGQGHRVTQWAPTFVHVQKSYRCRSDRRVAVGERYEIELLHATGYRKNISLSRYRFHRGIAAAYERRARDKEAPDVILCGMPTPEMCAATIAYGQQHGVPVVLDVRDLWPDVYLTALPARLRRLARAALAPAFRANRRLFRAAAAIFAVSESYLQWGLSHAGVPRDPLDGVFPLGYSGSTVPAPERERAAVTLRALGVDPDKLICCFFGQFGNSYDLQTVIKAAALLRAGGQTSIQFVLCGDGERLPALRRQAAGLDNVIFTGWLEAAALEQVRMWSSIGLAAYSAGAPQSLPNKAIDYVAGGLALLSTLPGELAWWLERYGCGLTYQAGHAHALATMIRELAGDPGRLAAMRRQASALYREQFMAEAIYPSLIQRLEEILVHHGYRGTQRGRAGLS
jgi:glycosyltransferase involved in cell wall biosynthesis